MELHIAMVSFPAQGQISPMMRLACRLASFGSIRITFFASEWFADAAARARESRYEHLIQVVSISKGVLDASDMKGSDDAIVEMLKASEEMREPVEALLLDMGAHCIISDTLLTWTLDTAKKLGIPNAGLWAGSTACANFMVVLRELLTKGYVPVQEKLPQMGNVQLKGIVPGVSNLRLADTPFFLHPSDQENLEVNASIGERMKEFSCILLSTCDIEKEAVEGLQSVLPCPCLPVGPLLPTAILEDSCTEAPVARFGQLEADKDCIKWLDKQRDSSVIYVSFGSLANLSMVQFKELALGLEATQAPFLWVVRPNLIEDGSESLQDFLSELSQRTKDRGCIVSWAPQLQVLARPSVGLFLTHSGWNSTMEAIWNGVPLVTWPCFDEQNLNAWYVTNEWEIGVPVNGEVLLKSGAFVSRQEVEAALRSGLENEKVRRNMKQARDLARAGAKQGGSSFANFEKFLNSVRSGTLFKAC